MADIPVPKIEEQMVGVVLDILACEDITQADLAMRAGISNKHLNELLNRKTSGSFKTWERISEVLDFRWQITNGGGR